MCRDTLSYYDIRYIATSSQIEWIASTATTAKVLVMLMTSTAIPETLTVTQITASATAAAFNPVPTTSGTTSTTHDAVTKKSYFTFSSPPLVKSTFVPTDHVTTPSGSVNSYRGNDIDDTVNFLNIAISISVAGATLIVLLLVAAILYRRVYWKKFVGR